MKPRDDVSTLVLLSRSFRDDESGECLLKQGAVFFQPGRQLEVRAELFPSSKTPTGLRWSSSVGPEDPISSGSPCKAEIVTREEPILQILLPATRQYFQMFKP